MTLAEKLRSDRADVARRIIEARSKRQGTTALCKLNRDLTIRELRANLRKGKRQ